MFGLCQYDGKSLVRKVVYLEHIVLPIEQCMDEQSMGPLKAGELFSIRDMELDYFRHRERAMAHDPALEFSYL